MSTVTYTFRHNGEVIHTPPVPSTLSREEIQRQASQRWPEVAYAVMNIDNNNVITFQLPTATKQ